MYLFRVYSASLFFISEIVDHYVLVTLTTSSIHSIACQTNLIHLREALICQKRIHFNLHIFSVTTISFCVAAFSETLSIKQPY